MKGRITQSGCAWKLRRRRCGVRRWYLFGGQSRIVRINGRNVEAAADGVLFLMNNVDKPGMVGYIGSLMGEHQVNIASMSLNRDEEGGEALMLLNLDHVPPALLDAVAKIRRSPM